MSLVNMQSLLKDAQNNGRAVGAFNVFNVEGIIADIAAAEKMNTPVILALAESQLKFLDFEVMAFAMKKLGEGSAVPVAMQFDHGKSIDMVKKAMDYGFSSVMFDGYDMPLEEKIKITAEIAEMAHEKGIAVEAPLGRINNVRKQEEVKYEHDKLTDPDLVGDFVTRTKVDNLAVSIGTIHGMMDGGTTLDFDRLGKIRKATGAYLSLHGGSGVKDNDYKKAIQMGVAKISIFTRISDAAVTYIINTLKDTRPRFPELMTTAKQGMIDEITYLMKIFNM